MKQLIMTLALLVTAAGAWAAEKPIGLNVEYAVGDKITSTSDVYINIWWDNNDDRYGIMVTSTHSLTIESIRPTEIKLIESSNVLDLKNNGAQALYNNSTWLTENILYPSIAASAPTKVHVASGSGTLADPYVFEPGASGPAVSQVAGKSDEWEMTMPGANVLLNVEWKDATAMALTFNGAEIPTEGVTAYIGYEDEFIAKLTAAVTNSDKNDAAVTTTADDLACESKNQNVIEFQTTPNTSSNSGTLPYIKFLKEGTVQLTVNYRGNVDLSKSATQTIRVNVKEKTYTVDLAANTPDAAGWTGKVGTESTATFTALPVEAKANQQVTLNYSGRLKVKSVTATTDASPAATMQSITIAKGSTDLSGDKVLYYIAGDTYRQALARTENQSTGGLGWGCWEDENLTTLYFKEVTTTVWDVAIDGDSNFGSGKGSCTITLDTEINPTGHTFQFVAEQ